jgi:glycogen synthase
VGGLGDTIRDGETGFLFEAYASEVLEAALRRAFATYHVPEAWTAVMRQGMMQTFDWSRSSAEYARVYAHARARMQERPTALAAGASARVARRRPVRVAAEGERIAR